MFWKDVSKNGTAKGVKTTWR